VRGSTCHPWVVNTVAVSGRERRFRRPGPSTCTQTEDPHCTGARGRSSAHPKFAGRAGMMMRII
jgi:hypothetical protein